MDFVDIFSAVLNLVNILNIHRIVSNIMMANYMPFMQLFLGIRLH